MRVSRGLLYAVVVPCAVVAPLSISADECDPDECCIEKSCCSAERSCAPADTCVCSFTCSEQISGCTCSCTPGGEATGLTRFAPNINLAFDPTDSFGVKVSNVPLELEALAILIQNFSNWTVLTDPVVAELTATGTWEGEFEDVLEAIGQELDVDVDIDGTTRTVTFE